MQSLIQFEKQTECVVKKHGQKVRMETGRPFIIVENGTHYKNQYWTFEMGAEAELKNIAKRNPSGTFSRFNKEYTKGKNHWTIEDTRKVRKRGIFS